MSAGIITWQHGDAVVRAAVEAWAGDESRGRLLRDADRRRIIRLDAAGSPLVVKHFRSASGRHAIRERLKGWLGRSPADREARWLRRAHAAGATPLRPAALGTLRGGDRILVLPYVEGPTLVEALADGRAGAEVLRRVGECVAALHAGGLAHGDLHAGNILLGREGPVLLDLQHATRLDDSRRIRDLGDFDYSLQGRASLSGRLGFRAAALGVTRPFDADARARLRAVGAAAEERAYQHGRSRTRRAMRPGRQFAALRFGSRRGLRVRELAENDVAGALRSHEAATAHSHPAATARAPEEGTGDRLIKADARSRLTRVPVGTASVVVKELPFRGLPRALADLWRGSPARRAWAAGHGLLARGVGAARPLAFVEQRRLGLPWSSWLLLESLEPSHEALARSRDDAPAVLGSLVGLVDQMHRRGVEHGDLKSSHVFVDPDSGRARLIDLEGVRFHRRLEPSQRLEALAQLNASLPDEVSAAERRVAFCRYAACHPFPGGSAGALEELVARSLARRHRWSGAGCECAARSVVQPGTTGGG